jgi:hypothetical protein
MKTIDQLPGIDPDLKARMQEACDRIAKGIYPTTEERLKSAANIDRMREENAERFGIQNVAVDAVREWRDRQ